MKKHITFLLCCVLILFSLAGCSRYHADDFLGKTSAQIEAEAGAFDCCGMPADADGLYRNTFCGYTVKEPRMGFLGIDPGVLFFIFFDENGVAASCEKGPRPGG